MLVGRVAAACLLPGLAGCSVLFPFVEDAGDDGGVGGSCAVIVCPPDTTCVEGACAYSDDCRDVTCGDHEVCVRGECLDESLDEDGDGYPVATDCDDHDPRVLPGSTVDCSSACGDGVTTCLNGRWTPCSAPTECTCTPGDERVDGCGRCGTTIQVCRPDGTWGVPSPCDGERECAAGAIEIDSCDDADPCSNRTRTCGDDCVWSDFEVCETSGTCTPADTETRDCGSCGTETRTCTPQCVWGSFGACEGAGVCELGQVEQRPCGNCGTETRACDASCAWGDWSDCGEGVCSPGETYSRPCGRCGLELQVCQGDCNWGAFGSCDGQGSCDPFSSEERPCGNCGTQYRSCNGSCEWDPWGGCQGEGECAPNAIDDTCSLGCGTRSCDVTCSWGECSAQNGCRCVAEQMIFPGDACPGFEVDSLYNCPGDVVARRYRCEEVVFGTCEWSPQSCPP